MNEPPADIATDFETTHPFEFDWIGYNRPTIAVVEAVAVVTDRNPTDLPPLRECVDGGALDELICSAPRQTGRSTQVTFRYAGCTITVDSAMGIDVRELED